VHQDKEDYVLKRWA